MYDDCIETFTDLLFWILNKRTKREQKNSYEKEVYSSAQTAS